MDQLYFVYIPILSHWSILENVGVIDMSVCTSVAEWNKCIYISLQLRGAILCLCSLKISGKVREFDHDWRVATL